MSLLEHRTEGLHVVRWVRDDAIGVDASEQSASFLLAPDALAPWPPRALADIDEAAIEAVLALKPEVILLGTGVRQAMAPPRVMAAFLSRGVGLMTLPALMSPHVHPSMWVFIIVYGLDWVATVPPTVAICREWFGAASGPIVFGWVFASHQVGAALAATGAGVVRDVTGDYDPAFYSAAGLCAVAALMSYAIRRRPQPVLA